MLTASCRRPAEDIRAFSGKLFARHFRAYQAAETTEGAHDYWNVENNHATCHPFTEPCKLHQHGSSAAISSASKHRSRAERRVICPAVIEHGHRDLGVMCFSFVGKNVDQRFSGAVDRQGCFLLRRGDRIYNTLMDSTLEAEQKCTRFKSSSKLLYIEIVDSSAHTLYHVAWPASFPYCACTLHGTHILGGQYRRRCSVYGVGTLLVRFYFTEEMKVSPHD